MSGLLKAASAGAVQGFAPRDLRTASAQGAGEDPEVARLTRLAAELQHRLAAERKAGEEAARKARAEGEASGRAAAVSDYARQIAAVQEACAAAVTAWQLRLADLERLAPALAAAALAKIFTPPADQAQLVAGCLVRHLETLQLRTAVGIRVSVADFDAPAAALLAQERAASLPVRVDPELPSGACVIDLRLGHVEIGPNVQWPALAALLADMEAVDGAP